ncbi:esterase family protein [Pedobacter sp. SYP-B3415]|uniref:alpha/beta hydrolase n=1 Tax=Pedobacter sp. SYP-B3415 TaxID=2496641 RepID=UPI00101D9F19|nr:alpha/beta hydrolase-fold protein [Pedobacter sp. SYP-B3415]
MIYPVIPALPIIKTDYTLSSKFLKRRVTVSLYTPDGLTGAEKVNLLVLNDGQDVLKMDLPAMLQQLGTSGKTGPVMVAAVHAGPDRLNEYGVAGCPDFQGRGSKADLYSNFITTELLPVVEEWSGIQVRGKRAFAGFSLGGLSAFDIAWKHEGLFDIAGVFSGAFWWRSKDLNDGYTEQDRIMHRVIRETASAPDLEFWLMTGTEDETADRNRNFIIDAIDDTIDLIRELETKGYRRPQDITYYEFVGGKHEPETWAKVMPAFLCHAFGCEPGAIL